MKKLILIVDDNKQNRMFFSDALRVMGYEIIVAEDGARAIDLARAAKPDLILMDLLMPEMSGLAAVKILKQDSDTQAIPIIAMTGQVLNGDRELMLQGGFDGYLSKPVGLTEIRTMVANHLNRETS